MASCVGLTRSRYLIVHTNYLIDSNIKLEPRYHHMYICTYRGRVSPAPMADDLNKLYATRGDANGLHLSR